MVGWYMDEYLTALLDRSSIFWLRPPFLAPSSASGPIRRFWPRPPFLAPSIFWLPWYLAPDSISARPRLGDRSG